MFGFGKKKEAAEQPAAEIYVAPVSGEYLPLAEVSDPVFSQGVMGDGYAVDPTDGVICAPVSGEIALIQDTLHAFMIRTSPPLGVRIINAPLTAVRCWCTSALTP